MCPSITHLPRPGTPAQPGSGSVIAMPPAPGSGCEPRGATAELATTPVTRAAAAANGFSAASTPASSSGGGGAANGSPNGSVNGYANGYTNGYTHANGHTGGRHAANGKADQQKQEAQPPELRAGSKRSRQLQPAQLVAGREVVGRRLSVWWQRPQEWVEGRVKEFDAATGEVADVVAV